MIWNYIRKKVGADYPRLVLIPINDPSTGEVDFPNTLDQGQRSFFLRKGEKVRVQKKEIRSLNATIDGSNAACRISATLSRLQADDEIGNGNIPTKQNRETWALEKGLRTLILNVVEERTKSGGDENDLLQMLLEGAKNSTELSQDGTERFVVDNCKSMYLGGYETTAVSAEWCLMLLAANQEWQGRVRAEVLQICAGRIPNYDMIRKMKQLTMVLNESLRLYPPVATISREALKDMKFGDIEVPKGVHLMCPIVALQTDPEFWGPDSYEFKPERFANGIAGACKLPHLYMPFGAGPRGCLGQFLALAELKLLIALILSNFSFTLSPDYVHSPAFHMVIEPEHGVDLVLMKL
ncbi:hypothetical protein RHSIM_Rhsim10G0047400 [Rhododendron simsii]|uniref:Cytochrome P450 n=1 Tax=Rhododendron simsii TaxID=118357 RepID=A0A834G9Q8_RHOSS|nr:hypothetical protein RHSIM_Rhsim10G0047400 [Rhododendron simsii]